MVDIKKWQDRIENLLQVQKDLCLEQINTTFTRNELIELRLLLNEMMEIKTITEPERLLQQKVRKTMNYTYKINILEALKEKGYTTYYIRQNKLLSESTLQRLRNSQTISITSLLTIAKLLKMNITDII